MKKVYSTPSISVIDVEIESLMAASNNNIESTGINVNTDSESVAPEDAWSKEHNSMWN
ncbi:MAG: hypothetical protein IKK92_03610 [Prevotella sp.]|nr:hypothetical protein [Prevotella sp.]